MFDNHIYNLLKQNVQEHKSLWRIKKFYKNDANNCEACQKFWNELEQNKEEQIKQLNELIKSHLR